MAGYKHPCLYCENYIPHDSNVCPMCGKKDPFTLRCPKCRNPIEKEWLRCSSCGLYLHITCPHCKKTTFIGDTCEQCHTSLLVVCPNKRCRFEQVPVGEKCIKCGKPLNSGKL